MHGRNLLFAAAATMVCSAAAASAVQQAAPQQASRAHSDCPQKRAAAKANKRPVPSAVPVPVSSGGFPISNIRRFLPDLMP